MVLVQKWPFFQLLFLRVIDRENVFYDSLKRKNAFLDYKNMKFKKRKNCHFRKGLTHGFGPKMAIFPTFFFAQFRQGKSILWYSRTRKRLPRLKKQEVQKVERLTFCQRGLTMVLVRKWPFFHLFVFRQYRQGKCILWYSRTKKRPSRVKKTRSSKSRKIDFFSKGVNPWFWSKNGHFTNFFFR